MNWRKFFDFREINDEPKPFLEHLEDLRRMLIKMIVVLVLMMGGSFIFQDRLIAVIMHPLLSVDSTRSLVNLGVSDPLSIAIELSFYAGLILSFPFLVLFLAEFIVPALTATERRMLYPAAGAALGLFLAGVAFAYWAVLPPTLNYFFNYSKDLHWQPQWSVREYFSFVSQFVISFGLAFELPLAVLLLVKLGILDYRILNRTRAFAVIIIFFFAAVITPTSDVFTLLLMGGPMYLLYEGCIWIAWYLDRRERIKYEKERAKRLSLEGE